MWKFISTYMMNWEVILQAVLCSLVPYGVYKLGAWLKSVLAIRSSSKPDAEERLYDFTGTFEKDLSELQDRLGRNDDLLIRTFRVGESRIKAALIIVKELADKNYIDTHILPALMSDFTMPSCAEGLPPLIKNRILSVSGLGEAGNLRDLLPGLWKGNAGLLIDGCPNVFVLATGSEKKRSLGEPSSESLVRGPRVSFNESLADNTALLRQLGGSHTLCIVYTMVGRKAPKTAAIAYNSDIANDALVQEVRQRIARIDMDDVPDSGYIEQFIEDNHLTLFPQVQNTERPDRVNSALMEGRVAILLDGSPSALIVPVSISMLLQSPEDYYERWIPGTLVRVLRYIAALISTIGPALYISFISFHQGLIPTKLAVSIAGSREGVPFPSLIEALIMEVSIEILREAGLRLPKPIGQTIGIVGGLVIGEAAVQAGIVSSIMVIVVAITAISSFAIPQYSAGIALRIIRFGTMFSAAIFGLYGVILFFLLVCSHLAKLKSFGIPYLSPAAPYRLGDWKDFVLRAPLSLMTRRSKALRVKQPKRRG
ncbi:spore germination protein [Paenibacillus ehimensis]|uniref:spore germination protein n=1 Tax=Paenibacillus ehimensis TaxID=79264 RepID=UPI002DB83BAA|nr:spore germination protein [Paenibacillus ehimensis]MEC0208402.1 spore germination protein [Paenibacillus ehimensis]